ncbi:MAG: 3-oxoacid CoA-transferase subunit A [Dehalococcoidia bacterium]|nr:3-oxoacid CoA-transferase subunit A [Dehalococcoidia bacterium]
MAINKIVASVDEAVADIHDGAVILVGGFGNIANTPSCLLTAVSKLSVKNLTVVSNSGGFGIEIWGEHDIEVLHRTGQCTKHIVSAPVNPLVVNTVEKRVRAGEVEIEMVPQGTLAERIRAARAGLGGILTPTGVGIPEIEKGKQIIEVDGRKYLLETAIKADFALIRAHKADRWGNLVYRGTSRTFNATMAGAARVTIAEVDEVVELGALDPEAIITPGVYVNRVVVRS